jgi:hypothetical protein
MTNRCHDTEHNGTRQNVTISKNDTQHNNAMLCHHAERRVLFITMLNVINLSVVMLGVVAPYKQIPAYLVLFRRVAFGADQNPDDSSMAISGPSMKGSVAILESITRNMRNGLPNLPDCLICQPA